RSLVNLRRAGATISADAPKAHPHSGKVCRASPQAAGGSFGIVSQADNEPSDRRDEERILRPHDINRHAGAPGGLLVVVISYQLNCRLAHLNWRAERIYGFDGSIVYV